MYTNAIYSDSLFAEGQVVVFLLSLDKFAYQNFLIFVCFLISSNRTIFAFFSYHVCSGATCMMDLIRGDLYSAHISLVLVILMVFVHFLLFLLLLNL